MRRSLSVVTSFVLAAGLIVGASPGVGAATCSVTNAATGTTYTTLQEAVDDAASGDTLEVRGTCIGETIIRATRLRLKGIATTEQPTPTLDGARLSRVLAVVNAKVVIRDLTITNGKAKWGAGIHLELHLKAGGEPVPVIRPRVTLSGDASVTGNAARSFGGGIWSFDDVVVILNDSASITRNTAELDGGGIWGVTVILNDSASITRNTAGGDGGGIAAGARITLNDSASVSRNTAAKGGGIALYGGTLTLNDSSSVTGNTAGREGGGIYFERRWGGHIYVCSDEVAISPNDPDDPPKTLPCPS